MKHTISIFMIIFASAIPAMSQSTNEIDVVKNGKPSHVQFFGEQWEQTEGYIERSGVNNLLLTKDAVGPGDFHIRAKLTIFNLKGSAATFTINKDSHFGFSGGSHQTFIEGPFFGGKTVSIAPPMVEEGEPFTFEVMRDGRAITFLIDGNTVYEMPHSGDSIGPVGFRPWRSTMRIHHFSIQGTMHETLSTEQMGYSIPLIDLAGQTHRQVIVDEEEGQYLGHPTTVLLEDNKTMIAVYPKGHGRGAVVMKRSTDGGLTWSPRLPVPDNWATSKETPTIHRVVDSVGVKRLIMFSGLYPIRMAVSEDDGQNWTPLEPIGDFGGIVAMSDVERLKDGRYMAFFHDDGRFLHDKGKQSKFIVYKIISSDGGLTWSDPQEVTSHPTAHLCEPGVIRSPDGNQLAMLLRENSRTLNSFVTFSNDEGKTWTKPVQLPGALTGDRHVLKYAPDGRIVCVFRDTTHISPTRGDFVAWVGTYEDIVHQREGQYRVRLLDNKKGADCGYAGLELLPDGTFVATTYCHLREGEMPLIASVRFTLSELDKIASKMSYDEKDLFVSGQNGYDTYRIPAFISTSEGTLLAFCEGRKNSRSDTGNIDMLMRRSTDGGDTWSEQQIIWDDGNNTCGNPCPVIDEKTGTIWLLMTHNLGHDHESEIVDGTSEGTRTVWVTYSKDDGKSWATPKEITSTTKLKNWSWYATGPGVGIQLKYGDHQGRMVIPCDHKAKGNTIGYYSHIIYSDDHGQSWQLGGITEDGVNECQVVELVDGRLLLNMRRSRHNPAQHRAIAYSEDGGLSWSNLAYDQALLEPRCQASILRYTTEHNYAKNRILFSNPASTQREKMTVKMSYDEGESWPVAKQIYAGSAAYSCMGVLPDDRIACFYERDNYGKITLARFTLEWLTNGTDSINKN